MFDPKNFIAENKFILAIAFILYVYVILPKFNSEPIKKYYLVFVAIALYVGNISWEVGLAMLFAIYMTVNKSTQQVQTKPEQVEQVKQHDLMNFPNESHPSHSTTEMSMNPEKGYIKEPDCDAFDTTKTLEEKIEGFGNISAVRGSAKLFSIDEN